MYNKQKDVHDSFNNEQGDTAYFFKKFSPHKGNPINAMPKTNNSTELKMIIYEQSVKIDNLEQS